MTDSVSIPWSPPRWLRRWAAGTLALLFALLALGAVVTSFRVGMADPVWPTRPWHLFTISWQEPSPGFLVEHLHRLAGFTAGAAVAVLAVGLWLTESRPVLRWGGFAALVALLVAFGQLHGTLMKHQRLSAEAGEVLAPASWADALAPTLFALALVGSLAFRAAGADAPGRGLRLLGVLLLVAVMAQGVLGGLRVYLNALFGTDLAAIHGVFSQVVLALAVAVVVCSAPRRDAPADDRWHPDGAAVRWGVIAAAVVFAQVVAGAVLRHTTSPLGPRLHLLIAFLVVSATAAAARNLRCAPCGIRRLTVLSAALAGVQVLLGVEAWMLRFKAGVVASAWQPVTVPDALTRTAHALAGYALFAAAVALALTLLRARETPPRPTPGRKPVAELEAVA
jgi:heme A synthase